MMEVTIAKVPFSTKGCSNIKPHVRVEPWTSSELVIICIKHIYICQKGHFRLFESISFSIDY